MASEENCRYFRFRLRFRIAQVGTICCLEGEPKRLHLEWHGKKMSLVAVNAETFGGTNTFELSIGGYASPEEACADATNLRLALLTTGAVFGQGLGIAVPRTSTTCVERPQMEVRFDIEDRPIEVPAQLVTSRSDFLIIEQPKEDTEYVNFEAGGMIIMATVSPKGLFDACSKLSPSVEEFNSHQKMVLELFNAAYFENSRETKFLTWMLAMEAVAEERKRPPRVVEIVEKMRQLLADCKHEMQSDRELTDQERTSLDGLKTTLNHSENESISQSIRRVARESASDLTFGERSAESFIKHCYDVRSTLVHSGNVGKYQDEFGQTVADFESLARIIVMNYLKIDYFTIPELESGGMNFGNVTMGFL